MSTTADVITCAAPIFFATTEGQTQRIAERIAAVLRDHGIDSRAIDVATTTASEIDWTTVRGAVVGASLHGGKHQKQAHAFVEAAAPHLNRIPSAFFSVSLSAASVNPEEQDAARRLATAFPDAHGWKPSLLLSIAGRLAYTSYGFFIRFIMKRIARKEGAPTDTSRDYELTNWEKVDRLAQALDGLIQQRAAA